MATNRAPPILRLKAKSKHPQNPMASRVDESRVDASVNGSKGSLGEQCAQNSTLKKLEIANQTLKKNLSDSETRVRNVHAKLDQLSRAEAQYLVVIKTLENAISDKELEIKTLTEKATEASPPPSKMLAQMQEENCRLQTIVRRLQRQLLAANTARGEAEGYTSINKLANEYDDEIEPRPKKPSNPRKRTRPTEIQEDDLLDLDLDNIEHPAGPRRSKKPRNSVYAKISTPDILGFEFTAIVSYDKDGAIKEARQSAEFSKSLSLSRVLERIEKLQGNIWERNYSEAWLLDAEARDERGKPLKCITRMCEKRRSMNWNGAEGVFACRDCADGGQPCLVFVGGGLKLLPLHAKDRSISMSKKNEARIWVREEVPLEYPESEDEY